MDAFIARFCLSLLLLWIGASASSNDTNQEEYREPRVSGRIVKLYSGTKPEPYICPDEGFQPDPSNCAVFYRCVKERSGKFTVFRYQCAPGTVYDPDVEICNHPRSTRRSECGGMKPTPITNNNEINEAQSEAPRPNTQVTANVNEIDGAQSEVPRPISTKLPVYTELTTLKTPTTLSWIKSTERQTIPTNKPWGSYINNAPSTQGATDHKTTKFSDTTTGYVWSSSTQHLMQTLPPKKTQHTTNGHNNDPCTSDGFMGDSENCRKFYRCVGSQRGGYVKYEFSCSESTVWDDEIQGCNHPWAVKRSKCGRSMSYDDKSTSVKPGTNPTEGITKEQDISNGGYGYKSNKTIQQQLQISHGPQVTQSQIQISNSDQVIQNQTQINYGDKLENIKNSGSKQNQTQISHGSAVSQTQTQIDYGNKGVQTQLQIDHSKDSSQSQVQIQQSTTTQSTTSTQNNNVGNNECSESGFKGDDNDCKKFYRCVDNGRGKYTKFEYFCGDGTVWDPEIEACNHAWAVKNCGGKVPLKPTTVHVHTTSSTTTTTTKSTQYHPEPTKTTQSYYTTSEVPNIDDEDDVGYGNQNIQETTSTSTTLKPTTTTTPTTTTRKSNGVATDCTHSGFIGDANDCKMFYRCVDNGSGSFTKYEFKCGDGTLWDPDIEACNHAWAVKNCGGSTGNVEKEETTTKKENMTPPQNVQTTVTLIQVTTQSSTQNDDYDTGYGSQNHEHSTTIASTKQPQGQESDKNSECKSSGFMGDENDCKKFYRCVDNGNGGYIRYEFSCGEGTVWDSKIEACNHAWAVDKCGGSNHVIGNTETTSQSTLTTSYVDTSSAHTTQEYNETERPGGTTSTSTTSSIATSPSTSNKCLKSGFLGDSSDCKKFYRCVDNGDGTYISYEFTCGEGTVWDLKVESCNHPWAVEKCGGSNNMIENTETTSQPISTISNADTSSATTTQKHEETERPVVTTSTSTSSSGTTGSSVRDKCSKSGFMGDSSDCSKFYRCVDNGDGTYIRYEFTCGDGTVWDPKIEACNHAWAVEKCGEGSESTHATEQTTSQYPVMQDEGHDNGYATPSYETSEPPNITTSTTSSSSTPTTTDETNRCNNSGFMGDKSDCKRFYRCVDNGKGGYDRYEFQCGEGTVWDESIEACNHAWAVKDCGASGPSTTHVVQSESTTQGTTKVTSSTEESESTQATKQPQTSHGTCESEGFYENPSDCKKFYRCIANSNGGYTKYDFNCGDGTVWNQEIQACDHESADKTCSGSSSNQSQGTEPQSESTTSSYSTTKKQDNVDAPATPGATEKCTSEGFFSHPNDCKKFIRCVSNDRGGYTQYEFSCGDGTVWVQDIQACDHDNDITSCNAQSGTTSKPQNTEGISSSTSDSSVTFSAESITPSREDDEYDSGTSGHAHDETDHCTSEGYFADKQDCRKFYRCVNNGNNGYTKYDFVCGEGTAWDSDLQTCNHINEVQSCSGSSHQENGNPETTTNKTQAETENTSSPTKTTTTTSESSSSSSSNSPDSCESEGYFGDSKDCKKFYRCVDNGKGGYTKYDFTCGDGTIWDQDITNCNHPQDVSNPSCGSDQQASSSSSTTSSATSSETQTTSSTTESSNSSQGTSDCSQEPSKKPGNNNITCDKAGYYANPNDCKKFYRCVDWDGDGKRFSVFNFECGEGTIWDPALDTCNHEDSVYPQRDCSQTQSQSVGENTTTEATTSTTASNPTTNEQTTQESTTSEQTTTQQSTTSEQTTTQQSTTSEQTTTQQSTTSEQTTTNQSTNEQTTTQQSTTSEQTTTQQPTTSEKTTTQESTTSEQTTTQQSTTSELTTTQQSTTSEQTTTEQTTTQQSTTSEKTTTQEPTTSKQTTTEQSTTSEQTTTQESTTSEQTTTQQSTTSEPITTQQSTTSELTTTEQTTTEQSTTSEGTTTQESTTSEQTTTEGSTTSEPTTTQESNEQTTQESTTTTEQTTDGTTEQSTTQTSSTESDSTEDQSTTESSSTTEEGYSTDNCPDIEDDQYLLVCPTSFKRHPKYCNMFYQCIEDDETYEAKVAMFKCPNETIYDESQTQCVTEDKADKKCEGEIANKRRFKRLGLNYKEPIVADKAKKSCTTAGYFSFEKNSECSKGFLKCESKDSQMKGHVYQCPDGYVYWSISKRCERAENVRDCKRSSNDWTGRWNIPVERNNIASS